VPDSTLQPGSLVLYKSGPARVTAITDKIDIALDGGKTKRVRDKDVQLLHPGPVAGLGAALDAPEPSVDEAWELLQGETATLADLAELLYGEFTPATAWGSWRLVADGLYFEGTPEALQARAAEAVAADKAEREQKARAEQDWEDLLDRLRSGEIIDEDYKTLGEVERVALGQVERSRILAALDIPQTPEAAHRFLVGCGYWDEHHNPHPGRTGVSLGEPEHGVPALPDEVRQDLTHLAAYAIDDIGNQDPDDAISIDGDRLWVHIADVAALVTPDSELDLTARARAANLYLPDVVHPMLPHAVTEQLGLGLASESPALSIGFRVQGGEISDVQIMSSRVRVTRTTYQDADGQLDRGDLAAMLRLAQDYQAARLARGATSIDMPEVIIKVIDGEVSIRPMERGGSRELVTNLMLMAGEAVARFAADNGLVVPYVHQSPPDQIQQPESLSAMYGYLRTFKPSSASLVPGLHAGLGIEPYTRATSPLRRYLDLVTHQQLRALLAGGTPLDEEGMIERIGASDAVSGLVRRTERLSNTHWKLVYLRQNPDWQGEGVVVALEERKAVIIVPELAYQTKIRLREGMVLDQRLKLSVSEVNLPGQSVSFRIAP
jgi:exoribonuclease-2